MLLPIVEIFKMRIRIICYEDVGAWILGKFALKLAEQIIILGHQVDIAKIPDKTADINHHIIYYDYDGESSSTDTIMITHIDSPVKLYKLLVQLKNSFGICMSKSTLVRLVQLGLQSNKLAYVTPPQDGRLQPRKIRLGIFSKTHNDGRKNEWVVGELAHRISANTFEFVIVGTGWESEVEKLRTAGFDVFYQSTFQIEIYDAKLQSVDYFLYFSFDEGSMAFLDAIAVDVKTIVTSQGFHCDIPSCIDHPVNTFEELCSELNKIDTERRIRTSRISDLTWENYAKKHLDIWHYLLGNATDSYFFPSSADGVSSTRFRHF